MRQFRIGSKAGADYGVWSGWTPDEAFWSMVAEGGGEVGDDQVGTIADWDVIEMTHVVEGRVGGQWTLEAVEAGGVAAFASEAEAQAAVDALVATCGWDRDDLRVRAIAKAKGRS